MPFHDTINAQQAYQEVTDANVTHITLQSKNNNFLYVAAHIAGGDLPTDHRGSIAVPPYGGLVRASLADLFPGLPNVNRVSVSGSGNVLVSYE